MSVRVLYSPEAAPAQGAAARAAARRQGAPGSRMARDAEHAKRYVKRLAASFSSCSVEASAYGACLKGHMEAVERGACEAEFRALSKCFRAAIAKQRS